MHSKAITKIYSEDGLYSATHQSVQRYSGEVHAVKGVASGSCVAQRCREGEWNSIFRGDGMGWEAGSKEINQTRTREPWSGGARLDSTSDDPNVRFLGQGQLRGPPHERRPRPRASLAPALMPAQKQRSDEHEHLQRRGGGGPREVSTAVKGRAHRGLDVRTPAQQHRRRARRRHDTRRCRRRGAHPAPMDRKEGLQPLAPSDKDSEVRCHAAREGGGKAKARRGVSTWEVLACGRRHGSGAAIGSPQEASMSLGNGTKDGGVDEGRSVVGNEETTGLVVTLARETVQEQGERGIFGNGRASGCSKEWEYWIRKANLRNPAVDVIPTVLASSSRKDPAADHDPELQVVKRPLPNQATI
ncbi:hypothetical protein B0H14DRAFT_3605111 [Mycena olivaceomarginata]|nr:hypothetical protein B0H14DRAFT_3605111 [Mycena olivaceomarginata]